MSELLDAFGVECRGRTVLVVSDTSAESANALRLKCGAAELDVVTPPAKLEDRSYDLALVADILHRLAPTAVYELFRAVCEHLRPGAECLVETRTFLHPAGGGLGDRLRTPYAHLAFARDAVEEYYSGRGWPAPVWANPMCRATYFVLFRRAGLTLEEVHVERTRPLQFADKLRWYDTEELEAGWFRARLRRPADSDRARADLRALLQQQ